MSLLKMSQRGERKRRQSRWAMTQHLLATVSDSQSYTDTQEKTQLHRRTTEVTDDGLVFAPDCERTDKRTVSAPINSEARQLGGVGFEEGWLLYSSSTHSNLKTQMWWRRGSCRVRGEGKAKQVKDHRQRQWPDFKRRPDGFTTKTIKQTGCRFQHRGDKD